MKEVGSEVKTLIAIKPQVASGEGLPISGPSINRRGCESAVFEVQIGDTTGTPTRFGVVYKVQHKSGEESWADASGMTFTFSGEPAKYAKSGEPGMSNRIVADLRNLGTYIKLVATPTFAGGSSPKVQIAATCVLGQADVSPLVK